MPPSASATEWDCDFSENEIANMAVMTNRNLQYYYQLLGLTDADIDGKVICDVGAGPQQRFATEVEQKFPSTQVYTSDIVGTENKHNRGRSVCAYFSKQPFVDGTFDVTLSSWAVPTYVHDLPATLQCIHELVRITRVGGKVILAPLQILLRRKEDLHIEFNPIIWDLRAYFIAKYFYTIDLGKVAPAVSRLQHEFSRHIVSIIPVRMPVFSDSSTVEQMHRLVIVKR